ncbi:MAG: zinc ribbon domain-containing protein [Anaerolineae bacterium]|nr:zinc ribbon domain-containing protein [Anaerolineae bacterium]
MPVYTYRREDGTTFDCKQKFTDDALTVCPTTGQPVTRIIQNPGIIFKGSGFYVNDSKGAKNGVSNGHKSEKSESTSSETTSDSKTETKAESTKKEPQPKEVKSEKPVEKAS